MAAYGPKDGVPGIGWRAPRRHARSPGRDGVIGMGKDMLHWLARGLFVLIACATAAIAIADAKLAVALLDPEAVDQASQAIATEIVDGSLDASFAPAQTFESTPASGLHDTRVFWLKIGPLGAVDADGLPVLSVFKGRSARVQLYARGDQPSTLPVAARLPGFGGADQTVFVLPAGAAEGDVLYARVDTAQAVELRASQSTLQEVLAEGAEHARMIALTFGALMAMSLAALLIWFVLSERLLLLYATLFGLQALYMAYLSGQGFEWPLLSLALPALSYTWNVSAALSGAAACLFVREIAELRRLSPRVYASFEWLALAFVVLAVANVAQEIGLGDLVAAIGNLMFVGVAITTLVVAFLAWRRQNRAAGWFLIAWGLLEALTIATAIHLLLSDAEESAALLY
jgi:hypothetical protein